MVCLFGFFFKQMPNIFASGKETWQFFTCPRSPPVQNGTNRWSTALFTARVTQSWRRGVSRGSAEGPRAASCVKGEGRANPPEPRSCCYGKGDERQKLAVSNTARSSSPSLSVSSRCGVNPLFSLLSAFCFRGRCVCFTRRC